MILRRSYGKYYSPSCVRQFARGDSSALDVRRARIISVRPLARNNGTNTTARLIDISTPPRDQMDVAVHHRLPRCLAAVIATLKPSMILSDASASYLT